MKEAARASIFTLKACPALAASQKQRRANELQARGRARAATAAGGRLRKAAHPHKPLVLGPSQE